MIEGLSVDWNQLKARLDELYDTYDKRYLDTDPLQFVHQYEDPADREIVGLVASCLAYGNVKSIIKDVGEVLGRMGESPHRFVCDFDYAREAHVFDGFYHRFNRGEDIALLCRMVAEVLKQERSLGAAFEKGYLGEANIGLALIRFVDRLLSCENGRLPADHTVHYLLPSPAKGSACKRLNLYLRWMIRPADGLDLGLWTGMSPSALIMPVDTHIARISRQIRLTARKSADWKMAVEITSALKQIDSDDPIRYDFSLCRLGILDECPTQQNSEICGSCMIRDICRL